MSSDDIPVFVAARHEFDNQFGNLARGKRNWQLVAATSLALLTLVLVAYIRMAATAHITPYVVEVDHLGRAVAFGPATPLRDTDRRIIIAQLTQFIRNIRTVAQSDLVEREYLRLAYAFVDQRAAQFLNTYYADPTHDPRTLALQGPRTVDVNAVLPLPTNGTSTSPTLWKVTWTETTIPTGGTGSLHTDAWEAFLTIRLVPPTTADRIQDNPLGLYISAISWTQVASRSGTPSFDPTRQ